MKTTTKQTGRPQVVVRVTIGGQTFEEVVAGPLVAMQPKGGK
jgi:hypothetical protein